MRQPHLLGLVILLLLSQAAAQSPAPLSYQGPILESTRAAPLRQPLWTMKTDQEPGMSPQVNATGNRVLVRSGGRLQARDLRTGRLVWQAEGNLLALTSSSAFLKSGKNLIRRDPATGRVIWTQPLKDEPFSAGISGGSLYVTTGGGVLAVEGATGRVRWQFQEYEMGPFSGVSQGVALWSAYQGEPHFPALYGFDDRTGERRYRLPRVSSPITVQGEEMLLWVDTFPSDSEPGPSLAWVDTATGQRQGTFTLPARFGSIRSSGEAWVNGENIFIQERDGASIVRYTLDQTATPEQTLTRYQVPDEGRFRLGPVNGLLLFETRRGQLWAVPTQGGHPAIYNGVEMPTGEGLQISREDTPISRLDALGNVLYIGRVDGSMLAYDLSRKKALYSVKLPWHGFGPSLKIGPHVILSTPGHVAVIRE